MHNRQPLKRDINHAVIGGVCAGIAEYVNTDPTIVRIIFVLLIFAGAGGIILYGILWIVLPHDAHIDPVEQTNTPPTYAEHRSRRSTLGILLILVGVGLLANNYFPDIGLDRLWPLLVILAGIIILAR